MSDPTTRAIPDITLGWRLRMAMEKAGLEVNDMSVVMKKHRATITRWTHDVGSAPHEFFIRAWADACDVPYEWLAGDLFEDPTVEAAPVPHPRRRATDNKDEGSGSTVRYWGASLACRELVVAVPALAAH